MAKTPDLDKAVEKLREELAAEKEERKQLLEELRRNRPTATSAQDARASSQAKMSAGYAKKDPKETREKRRRRRERSNDGDDD